MDLSEFYQPKNKSCLFSKVVTKLKQDDLEKVEAALLEKDITIASIEKFMQSRGISISWPSIRRHRVGECACGKDA
jgi:hypothetical protein